jgi:histidyl-tRNA synthetase
VEVQAEIGSLKSSIGGGGRYDNLTGIFGLTGISGVGISFGLDRIYDVIEELQLFPSTIRANDTKILFCYFDEATQKHAISLCVQLRKHQVAAEVYPDITKKIGKQFEYADKLKIAYACVVGSDEMAKEKYGVKNLQNGEQSELNIFQIIELFNHG